MHEELDDIRGRDDCPVCHGHWSRYLKELLQSFVVDRYHTVDVLMLYRVPHGPSDRPDLVEVRSEPEISPVLRGIEPPPSCRKVAGDRDCTFRYHDRSGVNELAELRVAVAEGEGAGLQEHARPRSHLSVVRDEEEVLRRAAEDLLEGSRDQPSAVETSLQLLDLRDELVVSISQRDEQSA